MLARFKDYIAQQHLFPQGGEVLLAVSGGRDSVCMVRLAHLAGLRFAIAHCNFHLRPGDCDRDQRFVANLAQQLRVPFHTADFDTRDYAAAHGQSIEEAARQLRYAFFADLCRRHRYCCVATAHHADDSIETFFLNLFRGTGLSGLHGIRPVSYHSDLRVVHPLLPFSRAEIDAYVKANGIAFVDDVTNAQLEARRNRIRLQLVPLLRQLYPAVDSTMQANMERLCDAEVLLADHVASLRTALLQPVEPVVPTTPGGMLAVDLAGLQRAVEPFVRRPSAQRTLLFELLRPYGFNATQVDDLLSLLAKPRVGAQFDTATHSAVVDRGRLLLAPRAAVAEPRIVVEPVPAADLQCPDLGRKAILVDADRVAEPLALRPWHAADRFCPFGMQDRSRLVSDLLKDMHVSVLEKNNVFVLCDARGRIVWVVGLRADNRFRVDASTARVLRLALAP